jgi:two-component system, chemotaxis family, sensor kinase CheA
MNIKNLFEQGLKVYQIILDFDKATQFPTITVVDVYRVLVRSNRPEFDLKIIVVQPDVFSGEDLDSIHHYEIFISTSVDYELISKFIKETLTPYPALSDFELLEYNEDVIKDRTVSTGNPEKPEDDMQQGVTRAEDKPKGEQPKLLHSSTIRIESDRIEELINLVGELIICRTQINLYTKELAKEVGSNGYVAKLKQTDSELETIADKLKTLSLSIRMVPVSTLFRKLPRIVRDLSSQKGKKIELRLEGEDTELDKSISEDIADPLMHLLRNSIDHGIEDLGSRVSAGKPPTGVVTVRAYNDADSIVIEVQDDGGGLNRESIKKKILERKLLSETEINLLTERELDEYIFLPGLSTAKQVTDISGRGVGLDVVKKNIESVNGTVTVESKEGEGTKFILRLPLTLSIIQSLILEESGEQFLIPMSSVNKIYIESGMKSARLKNFDILDKGDSSLPVFDLYGLLNLEKAPRRNSYIIQLSENYGNYGIRVDDIISRQEIVIKNLGDYLGKVKGFSGSTILGNGKVYLILDANELIQTISKKT